MSFRVDSETGRLRQVIVHRPGLELSRLTPDNVSLAVRRVRPYGVDVNSGVEARPGRKDPVRVRRFVTEARAAAEQP